MNGDQSSITIVSILILSLINFAVLVPFSRKTFCIKQRISLARPLSTALGRPIVCTLQGEDLFLDGLPEPYRTESLELIRSYIEDVDCFIAVSEYCTAFMSASMSST